MSPTTEMQSRYNQYDSQQKPVHGEQFSNLQNRYQKQYEARSEREYIVQHENNLRRPGGFLQQKAFSISEVEREKY